MKTKPVLIVIATIVISLSAFFVWRHYQTKPQMNEVVTFLNQFNKDLKEDVPDSLVSYFSPKIQKSKKLIRMLRMLGNARDINDENTSLYHVSLIMVNSDIKMSGDVIIVNVPVEITCKSDVIKTSVKLKIKNTGGSQYSIMEIDGKTFVKDYIAYDRKYNKADKQNKIVLSQITLAAMKTAGSLKGTYDSIPWFDHIDKQTYFYVVKGRLDIPPSEYEDKLEGKEKPWKMGLINSMLKEIVPVEYDLIHNVGGTIKGLIEVEKEGKKGFYNLDGKKVVPVIYDELYPLNDVDNLALLLNGEDYYYLKNDYTISDKLVDFKIADKVNDIKHYNANFKWPAKDDDVMETNDGDPNGVVLPSAYLVDWGIFPRMISYPDPLIKSGEDDVAFYGISSFEITADADKKEENSWLINTFNSVVADYLGDRGGLYETKNVILVDKKRNKVLGFGASDDFNMFAEAGRPLSGNCDDNRLRAINDTLYEFKTTSVFDQRLLTGKSIGEGPYYHYLVIRNGKLKELDNKRLFGFTHFVKMDDSYLKGCYIVNEIKTEQVSVDMMQYAKNEIFASYQYKFKNPKWNELFDNRFSVPNAISRDNVDDSLTTIDKYNINWLDQRIKILQKKPGALATK